jgi:hypothetical protein
MLSQEYSWLFDCNAGQQMPDYLLDAGTYACTDGGDMSAGFDLSSATQESSIISTTHMNNDQQSLWFDSTAQSIDQGIDFASLLTDADFSAPNPNLDSAVVGQNVGSLPAYQDCASVHQEIDAELFYPNAQSPLFHQYINPATVNQGANLYDTSAALSMQHVPDSSLREELERPLSEEEPCVLEFGAGLVTESGTEFGTQPRTESENADKGPQLDREQLQQDRRHEPAEPLQANTIERLNEQDEKIRELELALLQQQQQACSEPQQMSVPIP